MVMASNIDYLERQIYVKLPNNPELHIPHSVAYVHGSLLRAGQKSRLLMLAALPTVLVLDLLVQVLLFPALILSFSTLRFKSLSFAKAVPSPGSNSSAFSICSTARTVSPMCMSPREKQ